MSRSAEILKSYQKVAVVGLSGDPTRTSYRIAQYMQKVGYEIVGVNPSESEILGRPCYASLKEIPGEVEIVNVFRRPEFVPAVVEEAIARKAKVLWLQLGVGHPEAEERARQAGIEVVSEECIKVEHQRAGL